MHCYYVRLTGAKGAAVWWPKRPPLPKPAKRPKGKAKVEFKDMFGKREGEPRSLAYPLRGGPLDGETLSSHLYVKTGRGKATAHISVPLMPDEFDVRTDGGMRGRYVWNDERKAYWWCEGGTQYALPFESPVYDAELSHG
jgi:hypothetical protein